MDQISLRLIGSNVTASSIIIPIQIKDGLITIEGNVNGELGKLIIDTGAKTMVLNSKYFSGAEVSSSTQAFGLGGAISSLQKLKKVKFGVEELVINNITADVISLSNIEEKKKLKILGLIGHDILEGFEMMLNYREGYITLSQLDEKGEIIEVLPHTTMKVDSMVFQVGNFIPVLEVSINGVNKKMGLDTGGEINLLDINGNDDIMSEFQTMRTIKISGADGREKDGIAGRLYRVMVFQKYRCAGMSTLLANLENFDTIYGMNLNGILGFEFFSPWIMSINYRKKTLYIHSFKTERP